MKRILLLKTGPVWLLRAWLQEWLAGGATAELALVTSAEFAEYPFARVFRYPAGSQLCVSAVAPEMIADIRRQRYDEVVVLMSAKVPALYRHVFEFVKELAIPHCVTWFKHAPDGDYDDRFRAGFWAADESGGDWHVQALLDKAGLAAAAAPVILDVGCGRGALTALFRRLGYARVTGVELSRVGLADARRADPALALVRGDAYRLPFRPGAFDCLFVRAFPGVRIPLDGLLDFGRQCRDLLKPGGCIIQLQPSINLTGEPGEDPLTVRYLSEKMLDGYFRELGYAEINTYFTDRESLQARGAAALTREETRIMAQRALTDPKFHLTVTIARNN